MWFSIQQRTFCEVHYWDPGLTKAHNSRAKDQDRLPAILSLSRNTRMKLPAQIFSMSFLL